LGFTSKKVKNLKFEELRRARFIRASRGPRASRLKKGTQIAGNSGLTDCFICPFFTNPQTGRFLPRFRSRQNVQFPSRIWADFFAFSLQKANFQCKIVVDESTLNQI
jgi:hypothetical protein